MNGTRRFKMSFSTRHSEQPEPLELVRLSGDNAFLWRAETWEEHTNVDRALKVRNDIMKCLGDGAKTAEAIINITGRPKTTVYNHLKKMVDERELSRDGGLYLIRGGRS